MKFLMIICLALVGGAAIVFGQAAPRTLVLNGAALAKNKAAIKPGDASLKLLVKLAEKNVKAGKSYSVMNKTRIPPSGDKHDYMSQAPYWWPDPSKPNGLPYIRRDGETNPELKAISDTAELDEMIDEAETTALAYYFTDNEAFAQHSARLIRTWFLDEKTRQNPNLKFSQAIPGISSGRGIGLIETRNLYRVIDTAILLQSSKSWTGADHARLKKWFRKFAKWMIESDEGRDEADSKNNHGTYYDVQIIAYSIFVDRPRTASRQIEVSKERIKSQIEKDGSQPLELARTRSWGYTNMNLLGFMTIARLGENVKADLWNYETDGRSIMRAVEWLVPFAAGKEKWTHQQITPQKYDATRKIFRFAAEKYRKTEFAAIADGQPVSDLQIAIEKLTN